MLMASNVSEYARSICAAVASNKSIVPQASYLGLTIQSATIGLESLHALQVASGRNRIGRKLICDRLHHAGIPNMQITFGYLYDQDILQTEDQGACVRSTKKGQILIAPKLVLRSSGQLSESTTVDQFSQMFDGIAMGVEILAVPFKTPGWTYEDLICANGIGFKHVVGEMKGLSRSSRKNFSQLINHSSFSFSSISKNESKIKNYAIGSDLHFSSLAELFELSRHYYLANGHSAFRNGDYVSLLPLCAPMESCSEEEWFFSSTGFQINGLRVKLIK